MFFRNAQRMPTQLIAWKYGPSCLQWSLTILRMMLSLIVFQKCIAIAKAAVLALSGVLLAQERQKQSVCYCG
jgi:hypothetical protein